MLELETKTFEAKLPELLKTEEGRFVLIKKEDVLGTYESLKEAIYAGYEQFRGDAFFVRQVTPEKQYLTFGGNNLFI